MILRLFLCLFFSSITLLVTAQTDSSVFNRITAEAASYKIDTSAVPDDKLTRKIRELRGFRGGFNIDEAILFKLQEDESKGDISKETATFLTQQFTAGKAKRLLDNAVLHIYRKHFTYTEVKTLVKFYKTSAGQKLSAAFPVIMMQTLMAAKIIGDELMKK